MIFVADCYDLLHKLMLVEALVYRSHLELLVEADMECDYSLV